MTRDNNMQDCTDFLQKLIQTPSVNGKDNEAELVDIIASEAEKLGLPYKIIAKDTNRPNIFVGEDLESTDALLFVAHLDTVPVGDEDAWQCSPFSGQIADGKLYGRGAFDCKGGIALSLYALKNLADKGLLRKAKFVGVADEESGADSKLGLNYLLQQGLRAKAAVYTYGTNDYSRITIGHRGLIRLWVTCHGQSVHSGSRDWQNKTKGESAIDGIVALLNQLGQLDFPASNKYFPDYGFVLTPTLIQGGSGESIVPDNARVLLDIRTLPDHDNQKIISEIKSVANSLTTGNRTYDIEIKNCIPGALTDPESPIVKRAQQINQKVLGITSKLSGSGPANEGYMLISNGIPTITGYGPLGGNFHAANEYVDLDSLPKALSMLEELAL